MEEKIHGISAGSHVLYEVVENTDEITITIREAENHENGITLIRSVLPTLIQVLGSIK
jgi:hypothetical protein